MKILSLLQRIKLLTTILTILFCSSSSANGIVIFNNSTSGFSIGKQVDVFEDKSGHLSLTQILNQEYQNKFVKSNADIPNFGNTHLAVWFRFSLKNISDKNLF